MKLQVKAIYKKESIEDGQFGAYFIIDEGAKADAKGKKPVLFVVSMEHYGQTGDDDFEARKKAEPFVHFLIKALNHFDVAVEELRWSVKSIQDNQGGWHTEEAEAVLASIDNKVKSDLV
jgi:hypothetical protein